MLPADKFTLESRAHHLRRRLLTARRARAERFAPTDWPRARGPSPNPRHH